jgi:hypothetical protein
MLNVVGSIITLLFIASSKFRLIYCFFLVQSCFFIEKVHILRITHFSETTKDRNLIFGMGGDANVKLCMHLICLVTLIINIPVYGFRGGDLDH